MLLTGFYHIEDLMVSPGKMAARLVINPAHSIFEGHFPGQPVVPGVCMMQMLKELLETGTGKSFDLLSAAEMKFLALIDPVKNNIIQATLQYEIVENNEWMVSATLAHGDLLHFKFKGRFVLQPPFSLH